MLQGRTFLEKGSIDDWIVLKATWCYHGCLWPDFKFCASIPNWVQWHRMDVIGCQKSSIGSHQVFIKQSRDVLVTKISINTECRFNDVVKLHAHACTPVSHLICDTGPRFRKTVCWWQERYFELLMSAYVYSILSAASQKHQAPDLVLFKRLWSAHQNLDLLGGTADENWIRESWMCLLIVLGRCKWDSHSVWDYRPWDHASFVVNGGYISNLNPAYNNYVAFARENWQAIHLTFPPGERSSYTSYLQRPWNPCSDVALQNIAPNPCRAIIIILPL